MGCSCNKPKPKPTPSGLTQEFSLRHSDGRTETFGSRLERDAAQARERHGVSSRV